MSSNEELLTAKELANYLKLKPGTLYPKIRRGEIPAFKVFNKEWRFKKSDVDKWINENIKAKSEIEIQQPAVSQS